MRDPAILLYKDKWLIATKGMRADAKGWYLNLIIYQHDIGSLPNDIEELANLCDVRFSEFEQFKQVFEQVLTHKFELNSDNRLENAFAREIIQNRETFKEKRSDAGKLSYVFKYFRKHFKYKNGFEEWFKQNVIIDFDIKNEQVLKQVFKQNFELYINVNEDVNINLNTDSILFVFDSVKNLFDEKYMNDSCKKTIDKLLKSYSKEDIIKAIVWAKNDSFWNSNFLSVSKLLTKDKSDVKYIDVFLQKAKLAYISQKHNIDAQVKGWEDRTQTKLSDNQMIEHPAKGGGIQEEVEEKVEEKEEVKHNIGEKQKLVFPYQSEKFMLLWNELVKMPKWRKKPFSALQLTLHKLSEFDEDFVIELIENAITGNYQGIIFSNTKEKYEQFKNQNYGGKNIGNNAKKQGVSKQELANILYEHFQNRDNSNE